MYRVVRNLAITYYKNKTSTKIHRTNGLPSTIWFSGDLTWRQNDEIHREGKFAMIGSDYYPKWYENNTLVKRNHGK